MTTSSGSGSGQTAPASRAITAGRTLLYTVLILAGAGITAYPGMVVAEAASFLPAAVIPLIGGMILGCFVPALPEDALARYAPPLAPALLMPWILAAVPLVTGAPVISDGLALLALGFGTVIITGFSLLFAWGVRIGVGQRPAARNRARARRVIAGVLLLGWAMVALSAVVESRRPFFRVDQTQPGADARCLLIGAHPHLSDMSAC